MNRRELEAIASHLRVGVLDARNVVSDEMQVTARAIGHALERLHEHFDYGEWLELCAINPQVKRRYVIKKQVPGSEYAEVARKPDSSSALSEAMRLHDEACEQPDPRHSITVEEMNDAGEVVHLLYVAGHRGEKSC